MKERNFNAGYIELCNFSCVCSHLEGAVNVGQPIGIDKVIIIPFDRDGRSSQLSETNKDLQLSIILIMNNHSRPYHGNHIFKYISKLVFNGTKVPQIIGLHNVVHIYSQYLH